jgi:drug/metabolite transporter (DMT)-like permease
MALHQIPPLAFVAIRFGIAAVLLTLLLRWREGSVAPPPGKFWQLVWLGIAGNTIYQLCFVFGLSMTTAANSALLLAATPVIVALLGGLLGIERVTRHTVCGIALAVVGMILVLAARGAALSRQTLRGDLLMLVAVMCWAIYVLGVRKLGVGYSSLRITTLTMLTGTPGLLLLGLPNLVSHDWRQVGGWAWFGLAYSALLALVVAYVIYNRSVRLLGGIHTTIYGCVTPLVAVLVAWPVLGERPIPLQGIGAGLILLGVLLTRRQSKQWTEEELAAVGNER